MKNFCIKSSKGIILQGFKTELGKIGSLTLILPDNKEYGNHLIIQALEERVGYSSLNSLTGTVIRVVRNNETIGVVPSSIIEYVRNKKAPVIPPVDITKIPCLTEGTELSIPLIKRVAKTANIPLTKVKRNFRYPQIIELHYEGDYDRQLQLISKMRLWFREDVNVFYINDTVGREPNILIDL